MSKNLVTTLIVFGILAVVAVACVSGFQYLENETTKAAEAERTRPMTADERRRAELDLIAGYKFNVNYAVSDLEGISDVDLRAFSKVGCSETYKYYPERFTCGSIRDAGDFYRIGSRGFSAQKDVDSINVWNVAYLYVPKKKLYMTKASFAGNFKSAEELTEKLKIPSDDAQKIWSETRAKELQ